ncbi:MAG: hypothetical protein II200_02040, partial [Bacteroidaceae bacterium]|nr:hypothetical protein [Bacteroidaceae bacterium]
TKISKFGFRSKMLYLCIAEEETMWFPPFFGPKMAKTTSDVIKTSFDVVKNTSDVVFTKSDVVKNLPDFDTKTALKSIKTYKP